MSRTDSLRTLEKTLESFLDRVIQQKEKRLSVLDGINRLDEIARDDSTESTTEAVGDWFADHNQQLKQGDLKPNDIDRIGNILQNIKSRFSDNNTPETAKLASEIDRWSSFAEKTPRKVILKRPAETTNNPTADTMTMYDNHLERALNLFKDKAGNKKHILSVLDDSLKSAHIQKNKDALLLSGYIIYYLKLDGYLVDPYVKQNAPRQEQDNPGPNVADHNCRGKRLV